MLFVGIDLECDFGVLFGLISDIVIEGVWFLGNYGYGLLIFIVFCLYNIIVIDCMFEDNGVGVILWGVIGGVIFCFKIRGFGVIVLCGVIDVFVGDGW